MAEGLRRVAQLLARARNLLGEHADVVAEGEHVLEDLNGLVQILLVVLAGLF